MLEDKKKI